jgi:hypothetical protein
MDDAIRVLLWGLRRHRRIGVAHQELKFATQGALVKAHRLGAVAVE